MNVVRRGSLAVMLMLAAMPVFAQEPPFDAVVSSTFRVVPSQPTTRDVIAIRNDFTGCLSHGPTTAQGIRIDIAAGIVDYLIPYGNDESDCAPADVVENAFADSVVGHLPAGSYTVRFFSCTIFSEPEKVCDEIVEELSLQFVVAEAGLPRRTIPASSPAASFVLLGAMVLAALGWLRRR